MKSSITILCGLLFSLVFLPILSYSQSPNDKTVIGLVGDEKITYQMLKQNMLSGNEQIPSIEELEEFLPIFLEFKAKIKFAEDNGFLEDPDLLAEYELFAKQASYSHWLDNKIKQAEFDKYYDRASNEVKSRHILIAVPENSQPPDTLEVYSKLIEARNKLLNGSSFYDLNDEYSSIQNGRSMGGDLPWFNIGTSVKEFEDVIFNLEVGEISMPFRTQFGYHIVQLVNKRPKTLSRDISHIYVRVGPGEAKATINKAYELLANGESWTEIVSQFSEDNLSVRNDGRIGWVNYGRFNSDFVDSVMTLDPGIEFSKPIKTSYGYHIFRIDSVEHFTSEKQKKESYMEEFLESTNFTRSNSFVIDWLKKNYRSETFTNTLKRYERYLSEQDSTVLKDVYPPSSSSEEPVYKFEEYIFTVADFHSYLKDTQPQTIAADYIDKWFQDFISYTLDKKLIDITRKEFPEFQATLQNYKYGLAVYEVNDQYLWNAATVDTSELIQLYNNSPEDYSFPERYHYHLLSSRIDSLIDKSLELVKAGMQLDSLTSQFPQLSVVEDTTGVFTDSPYDLLSDLDPNNFSEVFDYRNRYSVFYLNKIISPRRMTFQEAFNRVLADYQPIREKKWLDSLKTKYNIEAYPRKLRSAFKNDNSLQ